MPRVCGVGVESPKGEEMSRHTPGPWTVVGPTATGVFAPGVAPPLSRKRPLEVRRANARLIAAAPELLEVARLAYDMLTGGRSEHPHTLQAKLYAALAKAEGK